MGDAQTTSDTYPALRQAIVALGDHHSFLIAPSNTSALRAPPNTSALITPPNISGQGLPFGTGIAAIDARLLPPGIGYIYIPGTDGQGSDATAFADALQEAVETLDSSRPCGWVVDLRRNVGGNMWPMIAGIGPVLGEGDLGSFVDPDSLRSIWYYADGAAGMRFSNGQKSVAAAVSDAAYELTASEPPPVAVLYGPYTASSGEAVAIAFRGRALTRSLGEPTSGLSTANATYPLSDGALLVLTVATDADRTGHLYGADLQPDQPVSWTTIDPASVYDTAAAQAKDWLLTQSACENVAG
jgi:C-terminal processing protease CtpA/Prc